jgi:hypothetical protein
MATDDKVVVAGTGTVDDNLNTRDQRRVGIWFLVVTLLTIWGLMSLGDSHAPRQTAEAGQDMSGASGNLPVDENPPDFSVNRPEGVIEWPGQVGQHTKYLTGQGNSPAPATPEQGVSTGVSPDTATDEASRKKAGSGSTPSDTMPPPGPDKQTGGTGGAH